MTEEQRFVQLAAEMLEEDVSPIHEACDDPAVNDRLAAAALGIFILLAEADDSSEQVARLPTVRYYVELAALTGYNLGLQAAQGDSAVDNMLSFLDEKGE